MTFLRTAAPASVGRVLLAALCAAAAAGCSSDEPSKEPPVVQLGGPSQSNRTLSGDETSAPAAPVHTEADVTFVQRMIPHHQQALEMTALVEDRTTDRDIRLLAERMSVAQTDEIAQMETWLTTRGEALPGEHSHHAGDDELMPGMLTEAQMSELTAARGEEFERLFLQSMIRHHEGAVLMVHELLVGGTDGQEPMLFQLAQGIDSDQRIEIARMKGLLAARS